MPRASRVKKTTARKTAKATTLPHSFRQRFIRITLWSGWFLGLTLMMVTIYQTSEHVQTLESQHRNLVAERQEITEALDVLEAEWAFLTRPERLNALAAKLDLVPMSERHMVALKDVPTRETLEHHLNTNDKNAGGSRR